MVIRKLTAENTEWINEAAALLAAEWPDHYADDALQEVQKARPDIWMAKRIHK